MRPFRLTASFSALGVLLALTAPVAAFGQESYKVEALKEAPPSALAGPVRDALSAQGYRIVDGQGKAYADVWLRKTVPASQKPGGASGSIQFPFLAEGELLGAWRFPGEGHDNRDQTIPKGVYTVRYGLQPVNGDHLGVSPFRDYALLLPAAKDTAVAATPSKPLQERSAESAGASHPAILLLSAAPTSGKPLSVVRDEEKNSWGAVLPLNVGAKGAGETPVNVMFLFLAVLGA